MQTRVLVLDGRAEPDEWPGLGPSIIEAALQEADALPSAWRAAAVPIASTAPREIYASNSSNGPEHPARTLVRMVRRTDGILVVADERHGGVGGMLKCALDSLSDAEIDHKPVGVVVCSRSGFAHVVEPQLRITLQLLTATLLPSPLLFDLTAGVADSAVRLWQLAAALTLNSTTSREARRDRGGYERSPIIGVSHTRVRPLSEQPDAGLAQQLLAARYAVGLHND